MTVSGVTRISPSRGGVIGADFVLSDTVRSGVFTLGEQFDAAVAGEWPFIRYVQAVTNDGAVGLWMLDETSGSIANDSIGSYDLTYLNAPTLNQTGPSAEISKAVAFNGTNENAKGDDDAAFSGSASGSWSVECWVKWTTASTTQSFMTIRNTDGLFFSTTAILIANFVSAGTLTILAATSSGNVAVTGGSGLNDGNWHHVVGTATSGGNMILYIDGVNVGSSSAGRNTTTSNRSVTLGSNRQSASTYVQYADVALAAAAYYDLTLTSTQVSEHYTIGS